MVRRVKAQLAGILVGGAGGRMGGVAKGLLRTADSATIVGRWRLILERLDVQVVLVGARVEYRGLGLEIIADDPGGIGPLGGLVALLRRAAGEQVLALACDMPFVSSAIVERLLAASDHAPIVAPRRQGRWEPLCARYDAGRVLASALELVLTDEHSLQRLIREVGAVELPLEPDEIEELRDWDTPGDVDAV
jgi:molybdenum cofactor guanylyltransferase